jgi:hypothetical protein
LASVTAHPDGAWVTQQTRNLRLMLGNQGSRRLRVVLRDRDSKFTRTFDDVFRAEGAQVLITPVQAPNATPTPSAGSEQHGPSVWTGY